MFRSAPQEWRDRNVAYDELFEEQDVLGHIDIARMSNRVQSVHSLTFIRFPGKSDTAPLLSRGWNLLGVSACEPRRRLS